MRALSRSWDGRVAEQAAILIRALAILAIAMAILLPLID
jgi:hypothetical protein